LNNNNISDEGSIALGKALLDNTTLRSLQLRKCGIHTEGVRSSFFPSFLLSRN